MGSGSGPSEEFLGLHSPAAFEAIHQSTFKALVRVPVPEGVELRPPMLSRQLPSDPIIAEGFGILLTYHTNLGLHDEGTKHMLAQNHMPQEIVRLLQSRPLYIEGFEEFKNKIQMLAHVFGLPNHAASMEYCFNSKEKGRVHFHAFIGPEVSFWGWQLTHRRVTVLRSHLMFQGLFPNVQVMKPRGRHGVSVCACHGMYYCLGPKQGQVFSHGTAKPFEDWLDSHLELCANICLLWLNKCHLLQRSHLVSQVVPVTAMWGTQLPKP